MQVSGSIEAIQGFVERASSVGVQAHRGHHAARQKSEGVREESRERDSIEVTRSGLREARQFRKEEHRALFSAKRQLKQIVRAVRDELKALGRAADAKDVERLDDDADDDRGVGLKQTLQELNRAFRHDVKQAFRDARDGRSLNGEQLVADTRAAFERLVSDVRTALDPLAPEPPAAATDDGEATGVAPATIKPLEPADTEGIVEVSAPNGGSPDVPVEDNGPLEDLIERIEALLAKLTEFVSPAESDERPEGASFTVEIAVTVYARATFSFEGQLSGNGLDAVS